MNRPDLVAESRAAVESLVSNTRTAVNDKAASVKEMVCYIRPIDS
jgi:hypothetical protein